MARWLLVLLLLASQCRSEQPCTALTTTVSGDSTVVTIDCENFIIIVTCAQEETQGCSSQKLPKVTEPPTQPPTEPPVTEPPATTSITSSTSSSSSSSTSSSSSSSSSTSTSSSTSSSTSTSSTTTTCTDCSTTSSTTSTGNLDAPGLIWVNGHVVFRCQQASLSEAEAAVRRTLQRLLGGTPGLRAAAELQTVGLRVQWRVTFGVAEVSEAEATETRQQLQLLSQRVAANRAATFVAELENNLLDAGAVPGPTFTVIELVLVEADVEEAGGGGGGWVVLVVILVLLAVAVAALVLMRKACQPPGPPPAMASKALWQLEEERWALSEQVLDCGAPPPGTPAQWRGQWSDSDEAAASEARLYDLKFQHGGRLEGKGEGRNGSFKLHGAFDANDGTVRWREVMSASNDAAVVECYGQWEGGRIDGFFTVFDVSALPQQIGQGHFALTGRGPSAKDAGPAMSQPRPPVVDEDPDSDMV